MTLVGIRALTYHGLMANWQYDDHHNNDDGNNIVLTRIKLLKFREEACDGNQQFHEKSRQIIGKIQQTIFTLLARKSSHNNND